MCAWSPNYAGLLADGMELLPPDSLQPQAQGRILHPHTHPNTRSATFPIPFPPGPSLPGAWVPQLGIPGCAFPQAVCPPARPEPVNFHATFLGGSFGAGFGNLSLPCIPVSPLSGGGFGFSTSSTFAGRHGPQSPVDAAASGLGFGSGPNATAANNGGEAGNFNFTTTTTTSTTTTTTTTTHPSTRQSHHHHHQEAPFSPLPPTHSNSNSNPVPTDVYFPTNYPRSLPLVCPAGDLIEGLDFAQLPSPYSPSAPSSDAHHQLQPAAGSPQTPPSHPDSASFALASQTANQDPDSQADLFTPALGLGRPLPGRAEPEERGADHEGEDDSKITVDSLLDDNMPAPGASKKRTRAAASLDEAAGPSEIKRSRSRSTTAAASARSSKAKPRKTVQRPLVIPDSDDVFASDEESKLFDLTKDDKIPEELMVPKEDNSIKLAKFECIICMDAASNLTVTHCGHMFCAQCLHQAMHTEVTKKICPMCRQKLEVRPKNGQPSRNAKTFFHLELKLMPSKRQGKQPVRPRRS